MKLNQVAISEDVKTHLKNNELLAVNLNSLKDDFERHYVDYFDTEMEITEEMAILSKSSMFETFCMGAVIATDTKSCFRRNFSLPKSVIDEMNKPKIIQPEKPKLQLY